MKYYLYSAALILIAIVFVLAGPIFLQSSETILVGVKIPQNNASIAGIQKYNIPPISAGLQIPETTARAVLVKDLATDTNLYQKDASVPLPIASTTKIMTALVASEYFEPNAELKVNAASTIPGSKVGLALGEDLTFRSLLYGMLLSSGNDAAYAISENYPGGVLGFVSAMNKKVLELDLKNTHFDNPAGFDSPRHYSSASDLSEITKEALKDSQLTRIFATKETEIVSIDKKYQHNLFNLNKLLTDVAGVMGVKTGYTQEAKENLVTLIEREGHRVLIVVLGSDDRFGETKKLIDWTYSNFTWPARPAGGPVQ